MTKRIELWDKIKNLVEKINDKPGEYKKWFIQTKFDSDDDLPLVKILSLHILAIVIRSVL